MGLALGTMGAVIANQQRLLSLALLWASLLRE